jgi:hypothetical protein
VSFLHTENFGFISLLDIVRSKNWTEWRGTFSIVNVMDGCSLLNLLRGSSMFLL